MHLLKNPFHILNASSRDNSRRIMELADELNLILDSREVVEARSNLTNPRKRLSAEVAWLPGVESRKASELLSILKNSPIDLLDENNLPALARTNMLVAGLAHLSDYTANNVADWILEISSAFEEIDLDELKETIDEERIVAGFPEVPDVEAINSAIQGQRRYYRQEIKSALDNLELEDFVEAITLAVESATNDGEDQGPILIDDLVNLYEVDFQGHLDEAEYTINSLIEQLRTAVNKDQLESTISPIVDQLIEAVENWDIFAQPIQVSLKSRGSSHEASHRVAGMVRGLAIFLFNEHDMLKYSRQLTNMLQQVFAEVDEVAETTAEDADTLDNIAIKQNNQYKKLQREITYEAEVGVATKKILRIAPEGIEWQGKHWKLDSITHVRWAINRQSIGDIPAGTTYCIGFGNASDSVFIKLRRKKVYDNFVERLWKSVGVRLLIEFLDGLRSGQEYRFGSSTVTDLGMELERKKLFGSNEMVFCRWSELFFWNQGSVFSVRKLGDSKVVSEFSHLDIDNLHILGAAIHIFEKQGGDRLSSYLRDI